MAPEILDGKAASCHSDVYALGIILWEISSRDDPFQEYAEARHLNTLTALIKKGKRPSIPSFDTTTIFSLDEKNAGSTC